MVSRLTDERTGRQADRQTNKQADRQTNRQTDRQTDKQTDKQTDRQIDRQVDRQVDRQTVAVNSDKRNGECHTNSSCRKNAALTRRLPLHAEWWRREPYTWC